MITAFLLSNAFYFNPRAPRGARHLCVCSMRCSTYFNPRAPRGARRTQLGLHPCHIKRFQSTCPARGTTMSTAKTLKIKLFQSTCPARGTTKNVKAIADNISNFNPRAPRGARLAVAVLIMPAIGHFNPRAPRGARQQTCTIFSCRFAQELQISR